MLGIVQPLVPSVDDQHGEQQERRRDDDHGEEDEESDQLPVLRAVAAVGAPGVSTQRALTQQSRGEVRSRTARRGDGGTAKHSAASNRRVSHSIEASKAGPDARIAAHHADAATEVGTVEEREDRRQERVDCKRTTQLE